MNHDLIGTFLDPLLTPADNGEIRAAPRDYSPSKRFSKQHSVPHRIDTLPPAPAGGLHFAPAPCATTLSSTLTASVIPSPDATRSCPSPTTSAAAAALSAQRSSAAKAT